MAMSDAPMEMWIERVQSGLLSTRASDNLTFNSSSACWHVSVHTNSISLLSKENNGWAICEIFSMNLR
jgi:hypothetical protein